MKSDYHAKYYAYGLTKRCSSETIEKFVRTLSEAQVQLNPHQIDAALFAFKSPLSKGAILADEVGLGKTIEAGIIVSQYWAERKKKKYNIYRSQAAHLRDRCAVFIFSEKSIKDAVKTAQNTYAHYYEHISQK